MPEQADIIQLKRAIGLPGLTLYGLGNILGAGIYVLIGTVASYAGLLTPVAFLVASLVAAFSAFTYAEMSARFPLSAGEAVYVNEGLHAWQLSRLVGLMVAMVGLVSSATIIRGCYGYLQVFVELPFPLVIILLVSVIGLLAIWGISQSVITASLLTLLEIAGLLVVIWVGRDVLLDLPMHLEQAMPAIDMSLWSGVMPAAFVAFFAFLGFEDMVNVAEEVKQPAKNLPLAIIMALLISTLFYFLVSVVAVFSVDPKQLAASEAPMALVFEQATGQPAFGLSLLSIVAVVNGALVQIIMASRMFYGMARKGMLWSGLARLHAKTRTPVVATLLVLVIILVLALWLPLVKLAAGTSFLVLGVFMLVNASLLAIKWRESNRQIKQYYPIWVPVVGLCSSLGLVIIQVT